MKGEQAKWSKEEQFSGMVLRNGGAILGPAYKVRKIREEVRGADL